MTHWLTHWPLTDRGWCYWCTVYTVHCTGWDWVGQYKYRAPAVLIISLYICNPFFIMATWNDIQSQRDEEKLSQVWKVFFLCSCCSVGCCGPWQFKAGEAHCSSPRQWRILTIELHQLLCFSTAGETLRFKKKLTPYQSIMCSFGIGQHGTWVHSDM